MTKILTHNGNAVLLPNGKAIESTGGGASNIVTGEFTTQTTTGTQTITIPYTGSGTIKMLIFHVKGGMYLYPSVWQQLRLSFIVGDCAFFSQTNGSSRFYEIGWRRKNTTTTDVTSFINDSYYIQTAGQLITTTNYKDFTLLVTSVTASTPNFAPGVTYEYVAVYTE